MKFFEVLQDLCTTIVVGALLVLAIGFGKSHLETAQGPDRLCTWVKTTAFENARCVSPTNGIYTLEMPGENGGTVSVRFNTAVSELQINLEPAGVFPPPEEEES